MAEEFLTLYVDPGETTGWCLGQDLTLLAAGQTFPMSDFQESVWDDLEDRWSLLRTPELWREGFDASDYDGRRIGRLVMEDWRLYPDKMRGLAWDQCRTARHIGALSFIARTHNIPVILQPAAIKQRAVVGGAQELFYRPLHENRHQNDAIMHFFFYTQTELMGHRYSGLDNLPGPASAS
jgi:hypothetical protein